MKVISSPKSAAGVRRVKRLLEKAKDLGCSFVIIVFEGDLPSDLQGTEAGEEGHTQLYKLVQPGGPVLHGSSGYWLRESCQWVP